MLSLSFVSNSGALGWHHQGTATPQPPRDSSRGHEDSPKTQGHSVLALKPGLKEAKGSLLQGRRKWKCREPQASSVTLSFKDTAADGGQIRGLGR